MAAEARLLLLVGGHATTTDLAQNFINTQHGVERFIERNAPPFIAKVSRPAGSGAIASGAPGRVQLYLDRQEWLRRCERQRPQDKSSR
jgi:hypothetical protein